VAEPDVLRGDSYARNAPRALNAHDVCKQSSWIRHAHLHEL